MTLRFLFMCHCSFNRCVRDPAPLVRAVLILRQLDLPHGNYIGRLAVITLADQR